MRPHQRHRGTCGPSQIHEVLRPIRLVPHLFGQQPRVAREALDRLDERPDVAPGGQFVMAALSGEQRPRATLPPPGVRPAVLPLAIPVVVVAMPAGTERRVHFEDGVHDAQRVLDERVVEPADSVAHEFEESRVHDVLRWELPRLARRAVGHLQEAVVRVLIRLRIAEGNGMDADKMTPNARDENARGRDGPHVHVALEEIGVVLEKPRGIRVAPIRCELRGTREGRDAHGERGRRVAAVLFPPVLRCDGTLADQPRGRPHHQRVRIEVAQRGRFTQSPGEQDREGDLVQLDPMLVRLAIDPEVLIEAAIGALGAGEINEGPKRQVRVARREQPHRAMHHVPGPDEMVATQVFVALRLAPRNRERGDGRPRVGLVFVGEQQTVTRVIQPAAVRRH